MTELGYEDNIEVGDRVLINTTYRKVFKVDEEGCHVRINKHTTMTFPKIYDENFFDDFEEVKGVYRE